MQILQNPRYIEKAEILIGSLSNALLARRTKQISNYYQRASKDFIYIFKENYFGESFIYIDNEEQCIIRAVRCFLFSKNEITYVKYQKTQKTTESNEIFNKLIAARNDFLEK